jgi:hypothetical protein
MEPRTRPRPGTASSGGSETAWSSRASSPREHRAAADVVVWIAHGLRLAVVTELLVRALRQLRAAHLIDGPALPDARAELGIVRVSKDAAFTKIYRDWVLPRVLRALIPLADSATAAIPTSCRDAEGCSGTVGWLQPR